MSGVVADTHAALWFLSDSPRLSRSACAALEEAVASGEPICVSAISVIEVTYLVEKGRLPEPALATLIESLGRQSFGRVEAPVDMNVARAMRQIPLSVVPDMPDRIIAGTAQYLQVPLVTRDHRTRGAQIVTVW